MTYRKSKKIGPFRLTASGSGLSVSGGVRGARVSVNSKGEVRRTVGIPGSGWYDTKKVGNIRTTPQPPALVEPEVTEPKPEIGWAGALITAALVMILPTMLLNWMFGSVGIWVGIGAGILMAAKLAKTPQR